MNWHIWVELLVTALAGIAFFVSLFVAIDLWFGPQ